jgi:glycosyltransferase involved in cell wall biosynthesis
LDFGPNIQALQWFCQKVWPAVRHERPDARFTIIGFNPSRAVQDLTEQAGVAIVANLPDLRAEACRHSVVVLPFVSGGGIKNKLLEAASLGRPVICTPRAIGGLRRVSVPPVVVASDSAKWARELLDLWNDDARRHRLGHDSRAWVLAHHTWLTAAREAISGLKSPRFRCAA